MLPDPLAIIEKLKTDVSACFQRNPTSVNNPLARQELADAVGPAIVGQYLDCSNNNIPEPTVLVIDPLDRGGRNLLSYIPRPKLAEGDTPIFDRPVIAGMSREKAATLLSMTVSPNARDNLSGIPSSHCAVVIVAFKGNAYLSYLFDADGSAMKTPFGLVDGRISLDTLGRFGFGKIFCDIKSGQ
jgi:hypothetical protein